MMNMAKGELAYLPSEVRLYQIDPQGVPTKTITIKRPRSVLILDKMPDVSSCIVLYNGEQWHVDKTHTYNLTEKR